jgi:hypothetical protein
MNGTANENLFLMKKLLFLHLVEEVGELAELRKLTIEEVVIKIIDREKKTQLK